MPRDGTRQFEPIKRDEWVPDAHSHHLFDTRGLEPEGDPVMGRRLLMCNGDVEIAICRPDVAHDYFYRNGEGDEVVFVHAARASSRRPSARSPTARTTTS